MKPYVSIDIETTGLNPEHHQILEIGAVIDDWLTPVVKLPHFHCYVDNGDTLVGSPYALSMHPTILRRIATREGDYQYLYPQDVAPAFARWLEMYGILPRLRHLTVGGKNFASFDRQFLRRLPGWDEMVPMQHRSIDPGNLYWNPLLDARGLPDAKTCMERAGIHGKVEHTAVADALVVVKLIRRWHKDQLCKRQA